MNVVHQASISLEINSAPCKNCGKEVEDRGGFIAEKIRQMLSPTGNTSKVHNFCRSCQEKHLKFEKFISQIVDGEKDAFPVLKDFCEENLWKVGTFLEYDIGFAIRDSKDIRIFGNGFDKVFGVGDQIIYEHYKTFNVNSGSFISMTRPHLGLIESIRKKGLHVRPNQYGFDARPSTMFSKLRDLSIHNLIAHNKDITIPEPRTVTE